MEMLKVVEFSCYIGAMVVGAFIAYQYGRASMVKQIFDDIVDMCEELGIDIPEYYKTGER